MLICSAPGDTVRGRDRWLSEHMTTVSCVRAKCSISSPREHAFAFLLGNVRTDG